MKKVITAIILFYCANSNAQNVGIGTTSPKAKMHIKGGALLIDSTTGSTPVSGPGTRLMWIPAKAAFRVGGISGTQWDEASVGYNSIASGFDATASGPASISMGQQTIASGAQSIAMGYNTTSIGAQSTALGYSTTAGGINSTAMGSYTSATGKTSIAMGFNTIASGDQSTAIGYNTVASGTNSTAMGSYVSTSGFTGCLTIGDNSTTTIMQTFVTNGMRTRFAGGYRFFTNSAASIGAFLNANANSWAALSDVRLKENFLPVNGEVFLQKIAAMPQYSWNYIGQDVTTLRHYGPMGQDFYKAFGKDDLGVIGCDTLINQQDFLGVNFIAIQALEKRTVKLNGENTKLISEINELRARLNKLENLIGK